MHENEPGKVGVQRRVREAADIWLPARRKALEALRSLPLMAGLYREYWRNRWREATEVRISMAQKLPAGCAPALDAALATLREEAGLELELRCWITARPDVPHPGLARRKDGALEFLLTSSALAVSARPALVARLALLAYDALEDDAPFLRFLMRREAALPLPARVAALDYARLHEYAAACFACRCANDVRAAAEAAFQRRTELDPTAGGLDLRALAEGTLASGGLPVQALVDGGLYPSPYFAAIPLVLDLFEQTPFRRDDPGAPLPPESFAARVLELDARMHPAWAGATLAQRSFVLLATFLAGHGILKDIEEDPLVRRQRVLQFLETKEEAMRQLAAEAGLQPWNEGDPLDQLDDLLDGPRRDWGNVHAVQIMTDCLRLAVAAGGMLPELRATRGLNPSSYVDFLRIGKAFRLRLSDIKLVIEHALSGEPNPVPELFRA